MQTILVTGGNGQVGQCIQEAHAELWPEATFIFADVQDLDITNRAAVFDFFEKNKPTWCINCAGYTAVDKAEENVDLCMAINKTGVQYLAEACKTSNAKMIHFSTDYVYHNQENSPMTEESACTPQSIYALTKYEGDQILRATLPESIILRVSWVCSHKGHNFIKTMLRLGADRDHLNIVFDQIGTPTFAPDMAAACMAICKKIETQSIDPKLAYGVFNFSNEGVTCWYDFAEAIFDMSGTDCSIAPIRSAQYPTPAKRPTFSVMDKAKIKEIYGLSIPHWRRSLKDCLRRLEALKEE